MLAKFFCEIGFIINYHHLHLYLLPRTAISKYENSHCHLRIIRRKTLLTFSDGIYALLTEDVSGTYKCYVLWTRVYFIPKSQLLVNLFIETSIAIARIVGTLCEGRHN